MTLYLFYAPAVILSSWLLGGACGALSVWQPEDFRIFDRNEMAEVYCRLRRRVYVGTALAVFCLTTAPFVFRP